jgi:hypothetical protein
MSDPYSALGQTPPATQLPAVPEPIASPAEMRSYDPSLSEKIKGHVQDLLMRFGANAQVSEHLAGGLTSLAQFIPPIGMATATSDMQRSARSGDIPGTAIAALGAIPGVGPEGKMLGAAAREAPAVERIAAKSAENSNLLNEAKGITAYHGSPHNFDKFDNSKIGTGEGFQSYGHGLYFAEEPTTAEMYRDKLSSGAADRALDKISGTKGGDAPGGVYQTLIKAEKENFIDWDKPLSEQSHKVQEAYNNFIKSNPEAKLRHDTLTKGGMFSKGIPDPTGKDLYGVIGRSVAKGTKGADKAASKALDDMGIPGIKYKDAGSRGKEGDGTNNFVVFNHDIVDVVKKYGLAGLGVTGAAGAASSDKSDDSPP